MVGGCCRLRWSVSVTLTFLLAIGFSASVVLAQEPPPTDGAEAPEEGESTDDAAPADGSAPRAEPEPTAESAPEDEPDPDVRPAPEDDWTTAGPAKPPIKATVLDTWRPVAPIPEKYDWIQLKSGEWLKGEFIAMYDDNLEFDSDELDLLQLDWADVKQVRTAQVMDVGFMGDIKETGRLWIEGDTVRIIHEEGFGEFNRSMIISITTGAKSEFKKWKGKVSLGVTLQRGNTDQFDSNTQMNFKRRTIENRLNFDYIANFSQVSDTDTVDNQRANASWDKFLTKRFFVNPAIFEWYRDPFTNISSRTTYSVGAGYQIVDTKRTEWDVSGGLGYQETRFESVQAGEDQQSATPAVIVETNFDQDWTKDIEFKYTYRGQFTNTASGKYNHHMVMAIETEWTSVLDFDISLIWDRTQNPQADDQGVTPLQDDYRMVVGLGIEF